MRKMGLKFENLKLSILNKIAFCKKQICLNKIIVVHLLRNLNYTQN